MKKQKSKASFAEATKTFKGVDFKTTAYSPDGVQMEITSITVGGKDYVRQSGCIFAVAF